MVAIITAPKRIGVYPYESPCDGQASDSEAFNRAVLDITAGGYNPGSWVIELPALLVLDQVTPALDRHVIVGQGAMQTTIIKKAGSGNLLFNFMSGRVGFTGGAVMGLSVPNDTGTAGGYTIVARSRADGYSADLLRLEDLYLGSGSAAQAPFRHIELDGSLRPGGMGLRHVVVRDVACFGSSQPGGYPVFCRMLIGGEINNLSVFPALSGNGNVHVQDCDETAFTSLNIDGSLSRSSNPSCGFTNKAGGAI